MKIGVIGLGAMGWGMAMNLHRANLLEAVWNRTISRAHAFEAQSGVVVASDPATLAARCEVILTCVSEDKDLFEVVDKLLAGLAPGKVVMDCSTVDPQTAVCCAERLANKQVAFLDAPVTGGVEGAQKGTLSMMIGGDARVLERIMPLLKPITAHVTHMGPVGSGQKAKAVNQVMVAGINQAVTQALALGQSLDLPLTKLIGAIAGGAAGNWFLDHRGLSMVENQFTAGFKVAHHLKDLRICRALTTEAGLEDTFLEATTAGYETLIEEGFGGEDISALYRTKLK
ncbi:6-phosphogluconate dehydrogenase, NAD-binding protein [Magnetococcus marinus MC-1]|uniref:6-phosphogluconate dehydrogenase, NAD-binding protein n=1 Tax=Magnetococcus marinus (strain ATCC BAA-1437 / JCM 17883 / MC-1) TaxID=156889 RepID=A0L897_MAGMM|nr:NAD(P)-dependent oxidoreductase [Magnetococcus marinus]ABK44190.1 6-phosphogluconate dehydrogenase, NAD-binding protein [Magnetococcus marinus MC-1]